MEVTGAAQSTRFDAARRRGFSTFELLLLALIGALITITHVVLRFPIKVPGHSGIVWMALLVSARALVPRLGAASTAALFSGLIAVLLGVGDKGAIDTFLSYIAAGVGVDVICAAGGENAAVCGLAGMAGNFAKFAVKLLLELWIGIPAGFLLIGRAYPAITHLVFGALGGYLGFLLVAVLRRAGLFVYLEQRR